MNIAEFPPELDGLENHLKIKNQLQILYSQSLVTFIFPVLASISLTLFLYNVANRKILISWFAIIIIYALFRYYMLWQYQKTEITEKNAAYWINIFIAMAFVSGVLWGMAGIILIPYDSHDYIKFTLFNSLTILATCGLVAGALIAYSVNIWMLVSFSLPALIPPALYLISLGDNHNSAFGGLIFLYYFFISVAAFRMNSQFTYYFNVVYQQEKLKLQYLNLSYKYDDLHKYIRSKYKLS